MRSLVRLFSTLAACLLLSTGTRAADDSAFELPFDLYDDHLIVVRGSIGRLDGLRFLIDSGSARTIIDRKIADKLHVPLLPGALKFQAFDEPGEAYRAAIPSLTYGPVSVPAFSGLVVTNDTAILTWQTSPSVIYQLQYNNDLTSSNWVGLGNSQVALSNSLSATNNLNGAEQRYYRIVQTN